MNLVNKKVTHETFGKGNVINYNDSCIKINFESGDKKFVFPDAFKKYVTFIDQKATDLINKKIEIKDEKRRIEEKQKEEEKRAREIARLEKEEILRQERQYIANQKKQARTCKVHPAMQSVFWCKKQEEEEVFQGWRILTGQIKSGENKGQPRRLPRMNQNSGCLLTKRDNNTAEGKRQIVGVFMANESFNGRLCEDGYIEAHPEYRLQLSKQEAEKMLFWNYYVDNKSDDSTIWNSGRQRYFDNVWMAQILRDIVNLKENQEEKEEAEAFLEHFCKINFIKLDELPNADGALMRV